MEVVIVSDMSAGGAVVGGAVSALLSRQPGAVLGLATGSSPAPIYANLVARYQAGSLSVRLARAFLLDEYVGLPPDHPQSYRAVIEREVTSRLDFRSQSVRGPDGNAEDLLAACATYDAQITAVGGVDLQLLGIGSDGHIGFNEPGSSLGSRTRLKTLTSRTRADNARFFGGDAAAVPSHVITQGVGTILTANHLVLVAWGDEKADAVARCVEGPITAMVPASALQLHPHATVVVDVLPRGKARADVEKLPDPRLGGKKSHDPPQECPCGAGGLRRLREGLVRCLGRDPVGSKLSLPPRK
jgi:glucosamine-6-phosphate deaminase